MKSFLNEQGKTSLIILLHEGPQWAVLLPEQANIFHESPTVVWSSGKFWGDWMCIKF